MNKPVPKFRPIGGAPLDVPDEELNALSERLGVPSLVMPPPSPALNLDAKGQFSAPGAESETLPALSRVAEPAAPVEAPPPCEKMTLDMPGYLMEVLRRDCAVKRLTQRYLVLLGLQAIGYNIEPADLVPDHRRPQRRTGKQ
jgi:hypothetical protein